jgi:hypothetical protein
MLRPGGRRAARRAPRRCAAIALALSPLLSAHSVLDFDDWMQRIDDGNQDLQRDIVARDRDSAVERARELEELYGLIEEFFAERGDTGTALRLSREGRAQAAAAVKHLDAKQFSAARARALEIAHGCRGCHIEYKPLKASRTP